MEELKRRLPFPNTCISSWDIQVWKMCIVCKWDDRWCHTLNPILHHVYKLSYLGQFVAQIIETWQANSSITFTLCNVHRHWIYRAVIQWGINLKRKAAVSLIFRLESKWLWDGSLINFKKWLNCEVDPGLHHTLVWPSAYERPCFSQPRVQLPHLFCGAVA